MGFCVSHYLIISFKVPSNGLRKLLLYKIMDWRRQIDVLREIEWIVMSGFGRLEWEYQMGNKVRGGQVNLRVICEVAWMSGSLVSTFNPLPLLQGFS